MNDPKYVNVFIKDSQVESINVKTYSCGVKVKKKKDGIEFKIYTITSKKKS